MLSVLQHPDWPCMHLISAFTQTLYNGRVGKWRAGKTTLGSAHSLLWHPHHAQSMIILQKSFVGVNVELPCKGLSFSVKPLTIWAVTHVGRHQCLFVQSQKSLVLLFEGRGGGSIHLLHSHALLSFIHTKIKRHTCRIYNYLHKHLLKSYSVNMNLKMFQKNAK